MATSNLGKTLQYCGFSMEGMSRFGAFPTDAQKSFLPFHFDEKHRLFLFLEFPIRFPPSFAVGSQLKTDYSSTAKR